MGLVSAPSALLCCVVVILGFGGSWEQSGAHGQESGLQGRALAEAVLGEEVVKIWDPNVVGLAILVGWWGSYVALTSTTLNFTEEAESKLWHAFLLLQSGLSLGICTIWSVYFVGMQAVLLRGTTSGALHRLAFSPALTAFSALWIWLAASLAFHFLMPSKDQEDLRNINRFSARRVAAAFVLLCASLCGLHFAALDSQTGPFHVNRNVGVGIGVAVAAVVASLVGVCLVFYFPEYSTIVRCVAALIVTAAVNGLLYCGVATTEYHVAGWGETATKETSAWTLAPRELTIAVLVIDLVILSLSSFYAERVRKYISGKAEELEKLLRHKKYQKDSRKLIRHARAMRFPMCLIPFDTFVKAGKLVRHEHLRDKGKLVYVDSTRSARRLKKRSLIVFFSHQWLSHTSPDPTHCQFHEMVLALRQIIKLTRIKPEKVFVWVDYSSVPQEAHDQQQLAIESLPSYVSSCSAFIIIAPQVMHFNDETPCNFTTYSRRLWCRLEVFCMILATMYMWRSDKVGVVKEESDETDETRLLRAVITSGADMNASNTQVFFVLQDQLVPMSFFDKEGNMHQCYERLLYIYEGDCTCCTANHPTKDGEDVFCDKKRLVTMLTGIYGLMLVELQKTNQGNRIGSSAHAATRAFAAQIVKERSRIFPSEFFETRIEAMMEQVEQWKKTLAEVVEEGEQERTAQVDDAQDEAAEALGEDESQANTSESGSVSSGGQRRIGGDDGSGSDLEGGKRETQPAQPQPPQAQQASPAPPAQPAAPAQPARDEPRAPAASKPTKTKDDGTGVSQILFSVDEPATPQNVASQALLGREGWTL